MKKTSTRFSSDLRACACHRFSTPAWKNSIKRMSLQENDQSLCCYRELKKEKEKLGEKWKEESENLCVILESGKDAPNVK